MRKRTDGLPFMMRDVFMDTYESKAAALAWEDVVVACIRQEIGIGTMVDLLDGRRTRLGTKVPISTAALAPGLPATVRILDEMHFPSIVDVRHPAPRIGHLALACLARFCPDPVRTLDFLRNEITTTDKLGQIDVPTTDGSGDRDTDGINIRTMDGVVRTACAYRGVEIGFGSTTLRHVVPATAAAALVGRPLADLVDIGIPMHREVTIAAFEIYPEEGMIVDFSDPGVPMPTDRTGIEEMVARELARA